MSFKVGGESQGGFYSNKSEGGSSGKFLYQASITVGPRLVLSIYLFIETDQFEF